ncbi:MAG: N-acetyl-gamma-glutamyl-phosphate reductase [Deltaproteobacteria bacterium]|nr:N-acetyl-gamma-glutamyl-phosphate reductase [Deltaproteobacteria bacterium]
MNAEKRPTRVAIVGASGYTGAELIRLLLQHPHVELAVLCARERIAPRVSDVLPQLLGLCDLPVETFDAEAVAARADVAFCALPHGASIEAVRALRKRGVRVFDLSADFRLRDPLTYAQWYGAPHTATELLAQAVYGLCELNRDALRDAGLVAVPGCYPTASTLPLLPLIASNLLKLDRPIVVHALSGVSGAGRSASPATHLPECSEGVRPYKVAGTHRHTPEIEQTLSLTASRDVRVTFTPTLAPMTRGILATAYCEPQDGVTAQALVECAREYYRHSPSVSVLPLGTLPDTLWVRGSNRAHVGYALDARSNLVVAMGTIDNLIKGAAGQAIQCMNLSMGFDEGAGLRMAPTWP